MSNSSDLIDKMSNLVFDAVPDPPRLAEYNFENQHSDGDPQPQKNAESPNNVYNNDVNTDNNDSTSTSSKKSTDSKTKKSRKPTKTKLPSNSTIIINSSNVKVGPSFKHYYYLNNIQHHTSAPADRCNSNSSKNEEESKTMLPHVQSLSTSKLEITKEDILLVKTHIGNGWKKVAKQIGYSKGQIEQFLKKYEQEGIDEVMYQILLDWKQCCTKNATIGQLMSAMWLAQEYECAEILAASHSNNEKSC